SYDSHDPDDALELGYLTESDLDVGSALWRRAAMTVSKRWANLTPGEFRRAVIHCLIDLQVNDLYENTKKNLESNGIVSLQQVLDSDILVEQSSEVNEQKKELEKFLFERVYRHPKVLEYRKNVIVIVETLFERFLRNPDMLPIRYQLVLENEGTQRAAADYIADMTDRTAKAMKYASEL
ncbi:MAG: metal-dependent phosphohydrolase, partial [Thermoguttaceae bacterium]